MRKDAAMKAFTSVTTSWVAREDRAEIMRIENASFDSPWTRKELDSVLSQANTSAFIAKHDGRVVGYIIAERAQSHLHIMTIAVEPEFRGYGIGTQLVRRLIELIGGKHTRVTLEVRETNVTAQQFFKALEFRCTKVLRDFYDDTTEDAYLMEYRDDWMGIEVLRSIMEGECKVVNAA